MHAAECMFMQLTANNLPVLGAQLAVSRTANKIPRPKSRPIAGECASSSLLGQATNFSKSDGEASSCFQCAKTAEQASSHYLNSDMESISACIQVRCGWSTGCH